VSIRQRLSVKIIDDWSSHSLKVIVALDPNTSLGLQLNSALFNIRKNEYDQVFFSMSVPKQSQIFQPVDFFRALGDDIRFALVSIVRATGEVCVCDLVAALDAPQPTVSRHLAVLRESCVLQAERRGKWVYYRCHPDLPDWVVTTIDAASTGTAATRLGPIASSPNRCAS